VVVTPEALEQLADELDVLDQFANRGVPAGGFQPYMTWLDQVLVAARNAHPDVAAAQLRRLARIDAATGHLKAQAEECGEGSPQVVAAISALSAVLEGGALCADCGGEGEVEETECGACGGRGRA
jgi:hypothetical protein